MKHKMYSTKKSLIINAIFNFIKTFFTIVFPIITFAYASRVLGVEGIGKVSFAKSFSMYFSMIAMLGVNYYGTREAAKVRNNKDKLDEFASELIIINLISTIFSCVLLTIVTCLFDSLYDYRQLLLIFGISVALSGMGLEWLYQALEEYRYIAIRSIIFQAMAIVLMLVLVKANTDVEEYALICVFASSGSYVFNLVRARKLVNISAVSVKNIKRHMKPIFLLFAMAVSIELYTVLDSTMLGFICGDMVVGLYTSAIKVNKMVNTLITSLGVVMIPRLSYCLSHNEIDLAKKYMIKVYRVVFMLSIPASVGLACLSNQIIRIFSGESFSSASYTMRLLTPIVIIIPFSIVTNLQIFIPMMKEKYILISTCSGAVTNIILNVILIPRFAENGAAISTIIAELVVSIICVFNIKTIVPLSQIFYKIHQNIFAAIGVLIVCNICQQQLRNDFVCIVTAVVLGTLIYFGVLLLLKNDVSEELFETMKGKFLKVNK